MDEEDGLVRFMYLAIACTVSFLIIEVERFLDFGRSFNVCDGRARE